MPSTIQERSAAVAGLVLAVACVKAPPPAPPAPPPGPEALGSAQLRTLWQSPSAGVAIGVRGRRSQRLAVTPQARWRVEGPAAAVNTSVLIGLPLRSVEWTAGTGARELSSATAAIAAGLSPEDAPAKASAGALLALSGELVGSGEHVTLRGLLGDIAPPPPEATTIGPPSSLELQTLDEEVDRLRAEIAVAYPGLLEITGPRLVAPVLRQAAERALDLSARAEAAASLPLRARGLLRAARQEAHIAAVMLAISEGRPSSLAAQIGEIRARLPQLRPPVRSLEEQLALAEAAAAEARGHCLLFEASALVSGSDEEPTEETAPLGPRPVPARLARAVRAVVMAAAAADDAQRWIANVRLGRTPPAGRATLDALARQLEVLASALAATATPQRIGGPGYRCMSPFRPGGLSPLARLGFAMARLRAAAYRRTGYRASYGVTLELAKQHAHRAFVVLGRLPRPLVEQLRAGVEIDVADEGERQRAVSALYDAIVTSLVTVELALES